MGRTPRAAGVATRTRENTELLGKIAQRRLHNLGRRPSGVPHLGRASEEAGRRWGALVCKGWGEAYGGRGGSEPGSSPGPGALLRRSPRFGDPAAAAPGARAPGLRGQLPGRVVRAER